MRQPNVDPLDSPIPGQSLTTPPKSSPYERPPRFVDVDEAANFLWDNVSSKKMAPVIAGMLDRGMYASDIASTFLLAGVVNGQWTPDVAMLMAKRTLASVVTVGHQLGVKNMKYKRPDIEIARMQEAVFSVPKAEDRVESFEEDVTTGPEPYTGPDETYTKDKGIESFEEDVTTGPMRVPGRGLYKDSQGVETFEEDITTGPMRPK